MTPYTLNKATSAQGAQPMTIQVQIRNVYGNELVYPVCETAKTFAKLLSVKTFNRHQIETIKDLGYSFEVTTAQKSL